MIWSYATLSDTWNLATQIVSIQYVKTEGYIVPTYLYWYDKYRMIGATMKIAMSLY